MFSENLLKLRKQQKISQYVLAEQLGMSRGQIGNYELGKRQPDFNTLIKIANYFNVTVDSLIKDSNELEINQGTTASEKNLSQEENPGIGSLDYFTIDSLKISDDALLEKGFQTRKVVEIPVYSLEVNEENALVESNIIGWQHVPAFQMDCICFKVPDDSMSGSGLFKDYIVTVKKQNTANDGQMVVVKIINGPVLIRRIRFFNAEVLLVPDNPHYQSERMNINKLNIIGVVTNASFEVK